MTFYGLVVTQRSQFRQFVTRLVR